MLATLLHDPLIEAAERDRYFLAFDFHAGPGTYVFFAPVVAGDGQDRARLLHRALTHLADSAHVVRAALKEALDRTQGTQAFLDLVGRFAVKSHLEVLRRMAFDASGGARAPGGNGV